MNLGTWTITIGGVSFATLADVLQPEGISGGPKIITMLGYAAMAPVYLNLGNFEMPRAFTMTRTHASDTAAHAWYQAAAATWAGVATVVLTHLDYEGDETSYTIANAKIEIEVATPIGPTTTTKIKFTGGIAS